MMKMNVPMKGIVWLGVLLAVIVHPGLAQEKAAGQGEKAKAEVKVFTFGGGTLRDFVGAVGQQFEFDLLQAASIDRRTLNLRIPKMRIPDVTRWEAVLTRYNLLSEQTDNYERLGRWVVSPDQDRVNPVRAEAIIFVPPKNLPDGSDVKVKAFSFDREEEALWAWLAAIARNIWIDHLRAEERRRGREEASSERSAAGSIGPSEELAAALEHVLGELDEEDRALVREFYFEERAQSAIASENETTVKAIQSRLARIRRRLKDILTRRLHEE